MKSLFIFLAAAATVLSTLFFLVRTGLLNWIVHGICGDGVLGILCELTLGLGLVVVVPAAAGIASARIVGGLLSRNEGNE